MSIKNVIVNIVLEKITWKANFGISDAAGPVAGVIITCEGQTATTAVDGTASISPLGIGTHAFSAAKAGYDTGTGSFICS
jgi:hypothetical protein